MSVNNTSPHLWGMYSTKGHHPEVGFLNSDQKFVKVFCMVGLIPDKTRSEAIGALLVYPLWMPIKAIVSVAYSIFNIVSFGSVSTARHLIDGRPWSRFKSVGCSTLSIATLPANIVVETVAAISHIYRPEPNRIDLLAAHLWTGFVTATRHPSYTEIDALNTDSGQESD